MKTLFIILAIILSLIIIYFYYIAYNSKTKTAPGLISGQLSKCPNTPNCYNSEFADHTGHYVSPLKISSITPNTFAEIKDIVKNMGGVIQSENNNYFSATFTSTVFGFVDDLEIRIDDEDDIIHIRSASRVGRGDMGVNKKRILSLTKAFNNKLNN